MIISPKLKNISGGLKYKDLGYVYSYKHPSVWTIPRFGVENAPLVFRVLESIPRFGKFCMNTEMEISNISQKVPMKIIAKSNDFTSNGIFQLVCEILQKKRKN